jgi:hypothetical protein
MASAPDESRPVLTDLVVEDGLEDTHSKNSIPSSGTT